MRTESKIAKWVEAGVIDRAAADRILSYERDHTRFNFLGSVLWLGGFAIFLGFAAIIGANWDDIPGYVKLLAHLSVNAALGGYLFVRARGGRCDGGWLSEGLIAAYAGLSLTFIMLLGQVYQTQAPAWQPLSLWLILISPFVLMLARTRAVLQAWIIALVATYVAFVLAHIGKLAPLGVILTISLPPVAAVALGQCRVLRSLRAKAGELLSYNGVIVGALAVSVTQILWSQNSYGHFIDRDILNSMWAACLLTSAAVLGVVLLRRLRLLVEMPAVFDGFLVVTACLSFLPFLLPHPPLPAVGAMIQCLYWGLCGWVAAQTGYPNAMRWAVRLIALRLVVIYIEEMGSLLQTGLGLIFSGVMLIALVVATRTLIARLPGAKAKEPTV